MMNSNPLATQTTDDLAKAITATCNNLLIVRKDLDLDRKLIGSFGVIAKKFFTGV